VVEVIFERLILRRGYKLCGLPLPQELIKGTFIERQNRFTALIDLAGREVTAHVPSTGRMRELLVPGAIVYLQPPVS
jgi:sugar fermentation stimulation protein A